MGGGSVSFRTEAGGLLLRAERQSDPEERLSVSEPRRTFLYRCERRMPPLTARMIADTRWHFLQNCPTDSMFGFQPGGVLLLSNQPSNGNWVVEDGRLVLREGDRIIITFGNAGPRRLTAIGVGRPLYLCP